MDCTKIKQINSFEQIFIDGKSKPLVICDIDETILTFDNGIEFCNNLVNELDIDFNSVDKIKEFDHAFSMYKSIRNPIHTDSKGFDQMYKTVLEQNGKIIFLTARNEKSEKKTRKDLESVGLKYNCFEVHYTNNAVTKGDYIKQNISLDGFDQIIFIDDYLSYIDSVKLACPQIQCYLFKKLIV